MSSRSAGRGAFVFIFIAVLVDSIGFGIILPVLPRLIIELTGVGMDRAAMYGGWLSFVYALMQLDRKSTRLNSSHRCISYAVFCLKKKIYRHVRKESAV